MDFGQHDVSFVLNNPVKMKEFFDNRENGIIDLIKEVWMNKSYPQNGSFKIVNKDKVQVLEKKKWHDIKWNTFLDTLLDYVGQIFEDFVNDNPKLFTKNSLDNYMMHIGVPLEWSLYHDNYDFTDNDKVVMPEKTKKKISETIKKSLISAI
jgi:hypothetical protein